IDQILRPPAAEMTDPQARVQIRPFQENRSPVKGCFRQALQTAQGVAVQPGLHIDAAIREQDLQMCGQKSLQMKGTTPADEGHVEGRGIPGRSLLDNLEGIDQLHKPSAFPKSLTHVACGTDKQPCESGVSTPSSCHTATADSRRSPRTGRSPTRA